MKKIDIDKLSDEVFVQVIGKYEEEFDNARKESLKAYEEGETGLGALLYEQQEALRRHSERFTVQLIKRLVDELQKDD